MLSMLVGVTAYFLLVRDSTSFLLLGIVLGALARDIGWLLRFKRDWPILNRVLDWKAVDKELARSVNH
jgi:hypothetical protein